MNTMFLKRTCAHAVGNFAAFSFLIFSITPTLAINTPPGSGGEGSGAVSADASGNISISGFVGIRKAANTTYALDVGGDLNVDGTITGIFTGAIPASNVTAGSFGSAFGGGNFGIGVAAPTARLDVDSEGSELAAKFKSDDIAVEVEGGGGNSLVLRDAAGIVARFANNSGWNTLGLGYYVRDVSEAEKASLRANGNGWFSGSVGIGIGSGATPAEKLEVSGAIKVGTTANTNAGTIRWTGTDFQGYDGSSWKSFGSSGGWVDNGANVVLVTASDNVGIGTASPNSKVHVAGSSNAIRSTSADSAGQGGAIMQGIIDGTNPSFDRAVFSHNAVWDPATDLWNVDGIGANDAAAVLFRNGGGINFIVLPSAGPTARTFTHAGFLAGSKMSIDTSGNVGIGTQTPGSRLHVQGSGRVTDNLYVLGGQSVAPGSSNLEVYGNAAAPVVRVRNTGGRVMQATENLVDLANVNAVDAGTVLKVTAAGSQNPTAANAAVLIGRVGISTTTTFTVLGNATNTLEVKGTIYADRVLNAVYAP